MSSFLGLTSLQTAHAKIVIATTKDYVENTLRKSQDYAERAADIALATALVESQLRVYANSSVPGSLSLAHDSIGHDHASVGIYQQQVPGWGRVEDCQPIGTSTVKFLHRLFQLNWTGKSNGQLAQAVQVSAFPDRYAERDQDAIRIRKALW